MPLSADRLVVFVLSGSDWQEILAIRTEWSRDYFQVNLRDPKCTPTARVAFIVSGDNLVALGLARSLGRSGDLDTRIRVDSVYEISQPLSIETLKGLLGPTARQWATPVLESGGILPDKSGGAVTAAAYELRPELREAVDRLRQLQQRRTVTASSTRYLVEEQRDALAIGLEASGLDSRTVFRSYAPRPDMAAPFLSSFDSTDTSEASMIRHDHNRLDDWVHVDGQIHDVVEFIDPNDPHRRVTAIYADKEGIERVTGTDLVYYRHHDAGFVLVQYKRMTRESSVSPGTAWGYRPDRQLQIEIDRMNTISVASTPANLSEWRLSPEPFYMKLVQADMARPEGHRLVKGMYFPLTLFELLQGDSSILGPKNGKRIGWHNARRYLTNGAFIALLREGWIGSMGATTSAISDLVNGVLAQGRGAVIVRDDTDLGRAAPLRRG